MAELSKINQNLEHQLYQAILLLKSTDDCFAFFRDLCTPVELKAMQERWLIAQILYKKKLSYREIHETTGISIATITRVARFLNHERYSGYKMVLNQLNDSQK